MSDSARGDLPILECFGASYRFLAANAVALAPAAAVVGLATGVAVLLGGGPVVDPANAVPPLRMLALAALGAVANVMFVATVLRKAVRNEAQGLFGVTFGVDELRLLGVSALLLLMFGPFILLAVLALSVVVLGRVALSAPDLEKTLQDPAALSAALEAALGPAGALVVALGSLALVAGMLWVMARLSMVNAATIGERRIVVLQTWGWSRGNLMRIIAVTLLTMLPAFIAGMIVSSANALAFYGGDVERYAALPLGLRFVSGTIDGVVSAYMNIPILALAAQLYKGLRPPEFQPK